MGPITHTHTHIFLILITIYMSDLVNDVLICVLTLQNSSGSVEMQALSLIYRLA